MIDLLGNKSKEEICKLLQHSPVIIYTCHLESEFDPTFITNNIKEQLGYEPSHFIETPHLWLSNIHPDDRKCVEASLAQLYLDGKHTCQYRFRAANGEYHWMRNILVLQRNDNGTPYQIIGYFLDITEQAVHEQQLNQRAEGLNAIFTNAIDGIMTISEYGIIETFNASAEKLFGYDSDEVIGKNINMLMPKPQQTMHDTYLNNYRDTGKAKILGIGPREVEAKRKDGTIISVDLAISKAITEGNRTFVGIIRDITERKQAAEKMQTLADTDPLTGLANRSLFNTTLHNAINSAKENQTKVAIFYIDLDQFKLVNDSMGHAAGDVLLQEAAQRLPNCLRENDIVARLGGDEFAVILESINHIEDITFVAKAIVTAFEKPFVIFDNEVFSGVSIGISIYPNDASDISGLLRNADMAMYKAKESGRSNWQFYSQEMADKIQQRQRLETPLRRALENDEFILFYQPQVDLSSGQVIGAEALLRWNHPREGMIPPIQFISILEETGLILQVGEWVLETAAKQNKQWQDAGYPEIIMAVNLCAYNLKKKAFPAIVESILHSVDLNPKYLDIEITEGSIISNAEEMLQILHNLKKIGVNLSVDDFGTGYSSLSYLKRLPLDTLKIDRSFITDITSNADSAAIAQSIIDLAHNMKMKVIAEGIETKGQLDFLTRSQCDAMQGFYFSKPLPASEFSLLLEKDTHLEISEKPDTTKRTILILDDEVNITSALKRLLRRDNYHILVANRSQDAFDLLASNNVGVIMSDQRMPDMTGTEFLGIAKNLYPSTVRIILSGYADMRTIIDSVNAGHIFKFLSKPWDDEQLRQFIRESFEYYELTHTKTS